MNQNKNQTGKFIKNKMEYETTFNKVCTWRKHFFLTLCYGITEGGEIYSRSTSNIYAERISPAFSEPSLNEGSTKWG